MTRKASRILSGLLAVCMVLGLFPVGASAEELPETQQSSYTDSVTLDGTEVDVTGTTSTTVTETNQGTTTDTTWNASGTTAEGMDVTVTGSSTENAAPDGTPTSAQGLETITGSETTTEIGEKVTETTPPQMYTEHSDENFEEKSGSKTTTTGPDVDQHNAPQNVTVTQPQITASATSGVNNGKGSSTVQSTIDETTVKDDTYTQDIDNKDGKTIYTKTEGNKTTVIKPTTITTSTGEVKWTGYTKTETTVTSGGNTTTTKDTETTMPNTSTTETEPVDEVTTAPTTITTIELPERPAAGTTTTEAGARVEVTVAELFDTEGRVIGYHTETLTTNPDGTTATQSEDVYGYKYTTVTTHVKGTKTTTTTVESIKTTHMTETEVTKTTKTDTTTVTAGERTLEVTVDKATTEGDHGKMTYKNPLEVDIDGKKPGKGHIKDETKMVDGFLPLVDGETVNRPEGAELYYTGVRGLESAYYFQYNNRNNQLIATQFQLKDSKNNTFYVYCTDIDVHPESGTKYGMDVLEEAEYLKGDTSRARHIRAIAKEGYWGTKDGNDGSLAAFKQTLQDEVHLNDDELALVTDGMALLATQAAIWNYAYSEQQPIINPAKLTHQEASGSYTEAYYDQQSGEYNGGHWSHTDITDDDPRNAVLQKIFNYLTGLEEQAPASPELDADNVSLKAEVTVPANETEADVKLTVDTPDNALGSYNIIVKNKAQKVVKETESPITNLKNYVLSFFDLDLNEEDNKELTVTIDGTQNMDTDAYLFTAMNGNMPNHEASQTFVGVMEAARKVLLQFKVLLGLTETDPTTTTSSETVQDQEVTTWDHVETTYKKAEQTETVTTTETKTETKQYRAWNLSYNNDKDEEEDAPEETTQVKKVEEHEKDDENAKTGDDMRLWFLVNELSALALAVLILTKRMRKRA